MQNPKVFGCLCPVCFKEVKVSLEVFVFERAIHCPDCKNIFCHWEGSLHPVFINENQSIRS